MWRVSRYTIAEIRLNEIVWTFTQRDSPYLEEARVSVGRMIVERVIRNIAFII